MNRRIAFCSVVAIAVLPLANLLMPSATGQAVMASPRGAFVGSTAPLPCEARIPIGSIPFTISAPGSYYVVDHLLASTPGPAITIAAGRVTIDLNGFTLDGQHSSSPAITSSGDPEIHVFGGTLTAWAGGGIALGASANCAIRDVRLSGLAGARAIHVGDRSTVSGCVVDGSRGTGGIKTGADGLVADCQVTGSSIFVAIEVGDRSQVRRCVARDGLEGIVGGESCVVRECTVANYGGAIRAGSGSTIVDCTTRDAGPTFENASIVIHRGTVARCTIRDANVQLNASEAQIADCVFASDGANLHLGSGCTFSRNTVIGGHLVVDGEHNRVEDNHFSSNARVSIGTAPSSQWNLFVRNAVTTSMIVTVQGNNHSGQLVQGSTTGFASDQPWANFVLGR